MTDATTKAFPQQFITKAFQGAAMLPVPGLSQNYNWHAMAPEHEGGACHLQGYYDRDYGSYHIQRFVNGEFVGNDVVLAHEKNPMAPEDVFACLELWELVIDLFVSHQPGTVLQKDGFTPV